MKKEGISINNEAFSKALKESRGKDGVKKSAKKMGFVGAELLGKIEKGKTPGKELYTKFCKYLGVEEKIYKKSLLEKLEEKKLDNSVGKHIVVKERVKSNLKPVLAVTVIALVGSIAAGKKIGKIVLSPITKKVAKRTIKEGSKLIGNVVYNTILSRWVTKRIEESKIMVKERTKAGMQKIKKIFWRNKK